MRTTPPHELIKRLPTKWLKERDKPRGACSSACVSGCSLQMAAEATGQSGGRTVAVGGPL